MNHWQVFDNDDQIDDFLQSRNDFASTKQSLRFERNNSAEKETPKTELSFDDDINHLQNPCVAKAFDKSDQRELEILQYKYDTLPRGLTPLEELFDFNDVAKKPKMESTETNVEEYNIGGMKEPKIIKLSKTLP